MRTWLAAAALIAVVASWAPQSSAAESRCVWQELFNCQSCPAIARALEGQGPDAGDDVHGMEWNGLFAAYARNCPELFITLLNAGADPNAGGNWGSLIYTLSSKWPHNDIRVNRHFAEILVRYGANVRTKSGYRELSAEDVKRELGAPDYPEIWVMFERH